MMCKSVRQIIDFSMRKPCYTVATRLYFENENFLLLVYMCK